MTKAEKQRATDRRRREKAQAPRKSIMRKAVTGGSAWAGQKFLADLKTPGLPAIPAHYTAAAVTSALELTGRSYGRGFQTICQVTEGLAYGQLGVQGYMAKAPIFG